MVQNTPELNARWVSAIAKSRMLSKLAKFDLARRLERLNVLCDEVGRDYTLEVAKQQEAGRLQRRVNWWVAFFVLGAIILWSLDFVSIWSATDETDWILPIIFFSVVFILLFTKQKSEEMAAAAGKRIATALVEFEQLSGVRLPYYDLELLDEDWRPHTKWAEIEAATDLADKRRAELIVEVYEKLVQKVQVSDMEA